MRRVLRRLVVGAAAVPLVLAVTPAMVNAEAAPGGPGKRPAVELVDAIDPVPVAPGKVTTHTKTDLQAEENARRESTRKSVWPKKASKELEPNAGQRRVKLGPVTVEATAAAPAMDVELLGQAQTRAAGVDGLVLQITPSPGAPRSVAKTSGDLDLWVDPATFGHAFGASWESRLRFVAYPDCAGLAAGEGCADPVELATDRSPEGMLSATVSAELTTSSLVVALAAGGVSADGHGDFTATPLSPSSEWAAGGSSGDFTWSYPMSAPGANGGPEPKLAITYSAQSVDDRTPITNNQGSLVGDGFGFTESYIARNYVACADDGNPGKGDLCWKKDNATLVFNGQAQELIQAADGTWRTRADDGSRIRHLTGGPGNNPDNNKEYWELTTSDGTKYYFGRSTVPGGSQDTNSVWWVPVAGNDSGEPCHGSSFAGSFCNQAWQWNLDYVVDPHGNTMSYWYTAETNHYAENMTASPGTQYVRGGRLLRIDYGGHTSQASASAPYRVEFDHATRCLAETGCDSYTKGGWPDTPYDQICGPNGACAGNFSPTFFNRHRLTKVTTEVLEDGSYSGVDKWEIEHSFRTAGGAHPTVLWPNSIQHTGLTGANIALPKTTLSATQLANRPSIASDGISEIVRYRLRSITSETGAQTTVNYTTDACTSGFPAPATNTSLCFPQRWTPPGETTPRTDWFLKYVVTDVTVADPTGGSPSIITSYDYGGGAAWAYDRNPYTKASMRTWSDWRGYRTVTTTVGAPSQGAARQQQRSIYFRGMDGDRTASGGTRSVSVSDSQGASHTDAPQLAGSVLETRVFDEVGGDVHSSVISTPWSRRTAGSGLDSAWLVRTAKTETREAIAAGGYRTQRVVTEHDNLGRVVATNDHGDLSVNDDQTCTAVTYADQTSVNGAWFVGFPATTITSSGVCGNDALDPPATKLIQAQQLRYDGGSVGTPPTKGLATHAYRASSATSTGIDYQLVEQTAHDQRGRPTSVTTPTGAGTNRTDATNYVTSADGTVTGITTVSDQGGKNHTTTTTLDPARGVTTRVVDPNGQTEDAAYDALGRLVSYWAANRAKTATPTRTFAYSVSRTVPSTVTTQRLHGTGSSYVTESVEILDALLRPRQTQAPTAGGGRVISGTAYTGTGAISSTYAGVSATGDPATTFVGIAPGEMPTQLRHTYDGMGRLTKEALYSNNTHRHTTTTTYPGADRVKVTPPQGAPPVTTEADIRGQVVRSIEHGTPNLVTTRDYDNAGRLVAMTSPAGIWGWEYDLRGRQIAADDPDTGTTTTTYTDNDLPAVVTDARGESTLTTYDNFDRATHHYQAADADPDDLVAAWTYDTVRKGYPTASIKYLDGADGTTLTNRVTGYTSLYAANGHQVTIDAAGASADLVEGFPTSLTWMNSYRTDGNLTSQILPAIRDGNTTVLSAEGLTYKYNDLGWLKSIQGRTGIVQDTLYDPRGNVAQAVLGQGANTQIYLNNSFDPGTQRLNRQLVTTNADAVVRADTKYSYDPAGNPTKITDTARGDTQCFSYDDHRRLTAAWTPDDHACGTEPGDASDLGGPAPYQQAWTYDNAGRRTSQTSIGTSGGLGGNGTDPADGPEEVTYTYGGTAAPTNAVTTVSRPVPQAPLTYTYDEAGNTTSRPAPDGTTQHLTWNADGKLERLEDSDGAVTSYVYDPDGALLIESTPDHSTLYLGDTELRWEKTNQDLSAKRHYTTPVNATLTRSTDTILDVQITDPHGTANLSLAGASVAATHRWMTPFGEARGQAPNQWPNQHGFLNKPANPDTGLTTIGARHYDTTLGKFISADPILDLESPQQLLGYNYANDNPITYSDPTGLHFGAAGLVLGLVKVANQVVQTMSQKHTDIVASGSKTASPRNKLGNFVKGLLPSSAEQAKKDFVAGAVTATGGLLDGVLNCGPGGGFGEANCGDYMDGGGIRPGEKAADAINKAIGGDPNTLAGFIGQFAPIPFAGQAAFATKTTRLISGALMGPRLAQVPKAAKAVPETNKIYSSRALKRMADEPGPYHNFPGSFDETIFSQGTRTVNPNYFNKAKPNLGNDSIQYRLPGELNGRSGVYEIFTRPSASGRTEMIMHRFFRPDY